MEELVKGQQDALNKLNQFMLNPEQKYFALCGYSGCGKTYLINVFLEQLPKISKFYKNILSISENQESKERRRVLLTAEAGSVILNATTHQASEVLSAATGEYATTIHSALGLKLHQNYRTGEETLKQPAKLILKDMLIIVDEATMFNEQLMGYLRRSTHNCKIIFVLDPCQLRGIAQKTLPVLDAAEETAYLTEIVRQDENTAMTVIGKDCRDAINNVAAFSGFPSESETLSYINSEEELKSLLLSEFPKNFSDYSNQIKYLCWTNAEAEAVNSFLRKQYTNDRGVIKKEVLKANSIISSMDMNCGMANSATATVVDVIGEDTIHDVEGQILLLEPSHGFFSNADNPSKKLIVFRPYDYAEAKKKIKELGKQGAADGDFTKYFYAKKMFSDLRLPYASTVHKAQGSTFDKAIVDVGNILKCNQPEEVLRLLYVACTRPRFKLYLYNLPN